MRIALLGLLALMLTSCGPKATTMEELNTREVRLPRGQKIRAEVMMTPEDMARGMMFRESVAPDHGMLFFHQQPGKFAYWMYQVRIPLDMMWLDKDRRIVEIVANAEPCKTAASKCPTYGGHETAMYVLELGGGMAAKYGLQVGDAIDF